MGRKSSISAETGAALVAAYGRLGSIAAAARAAGVSESAARRYLDELPRAATPTTASQRQILETVGASVFESTAALEENYRKVLELITKLEAGIVEIRESASGERYETRVSPVVLVAALKEARGYITAASQLLELMISVNEVRRFQQAVLDVMAAECDEPTRGRIIAQLRQRLTLGLVPGGGG